MDELSAAFEESLDRRTEIFENRSERWKESEKGVQYESENDRLQEMKDDLYCWIEELEDFG
jgi:hypothetical protein